jgi:hypothetical protein
MIAPTFSAARLFLMQVIYLGTCLDFSRLTGALPVLDEGID